MLTPLSSHSRTRGQLVTFSEVVHAHFTDEGPHAPQIFPRHCEENEALIDEEFAAADTDGSGKISFAEFVAYYERLKVHLLIDA